MKPETRRTSAAAPGLDGPNRLVGYAARFGSPSSILFDPEVCKGPFVETIRRGAFARSLRDNPDVRALWHHDTGSILGRVKNGTLSLVEDDQGLRFELELPDTTTGRDVRELVRRGDVDGCSFGFFALEDFVGPGPAGKPSTRELVEVHCFEITLTPFPAYDATEVQLRSTRRERAPARADRTPGLDLARARLRLSRD